MRSLRQKATFLTSLLTLALSSVAVAGHSEGKVTMLMAHVGDLVMFRAGVHHNKPACSTVGDEWVISLKTETGRAMYSLLLSAQAQGKSVSVIGPENGAQPQSCPAWPDRESPIYVYLSVVDQ